MERRARFAGRVGAFVVQVGRARRLTTRCTDLGKLQGPAPLPWSRERAAAAKPAVASVGFAPTHSGGGSSGSSSGAATNALSLGGKLAAAARASERPGEPAPLGPLMRPQAS